MLNRSTLYDLLTRYEAGLCTVEERELVEQWYDLLGEPVEIPLSEEQWLALESRLWDRLRPSGPIEKTVRMPLWRNYRVLAAAVAALLIIAAGLNWNQVPREKPLLINKMEKANWTLYPNDSTGRKAVALPDGSRVVLEPNAQLAVNNEYNNTNREVRLSGEASFDVQSNPLKPFLVYSGDIITRVLGTTFHIQVGDPTQPIQVTVQSGKVTVYRQGTERPEDQEKSSGVILTPNQKATYFPDNKQFVTGIIEGPKPISASADRDVASLVFNEAPIGEIIRRIELIYGTEIELERDNLADCPFTGNLSSQSLYTKLELICGTINGTYEVRGTKILIAGKGCQ